MKFCNVVFFKEETLQFKCHTRLRLLRMAVDTRQLLFIRLNLFEVTSFGSTLLIFREFKQWNSFG